jgi:hypothetical protein
LFFTHDHLDQGHPPDEDPEVVARYSDLSQSFHYYCWRLLRANQDWPDMPVYSRLERTHQGPTLDAEEFWRVLCYDTAQAVAAGLFKRTRDYPGLVFLPDDVRRPRTFRRNHLIDAIDPERLMFPDDEVSIQLGIPSFFSHMTREEYADEFERRLEAYEREVGPRRVHPVQKARAICNSIPIGKRLTPEDIEEKTRGHRRPRRSAQGPTPVWTSKPELRIAHEQERNEFYSAHRTASRALAAGNQNVRFPAGTYGWRKRLNVEVDPLPEAAWQREPQLWPE